MGTDWLNRLIGDWTFEGQSIPDNPQHRSTGTESVMRNGEWWVIEVSDRSRFQLTVDADTGRLVGDFVNWAHAKLWLYDGALDGDRLILGSRGPDFDDPTRETDYQDVWEIVSDEERVLTGRVLGSDGQWRDFLRTTYRRTR